MFSSFCKFCNGQFRGLGQEGFKRVQCKFHKNKDVQQLGKDNCTNDSVVSDDTKGDCQTSSSSLCSDTALVNTNGFSDHIDVIDQPTDFAPVENPEACDAEVECEYTLDDFELIKIIGCGTYATVFMVENKRDQRIYAMKVIEKKVMKKKGLNWINREKKIFLSVADCPFFVALYCCFQTASRLYFVMEFVHGGDLLYFMRRKMQLPEHHAKFYAAEIGLALNFLHSKGIIYRDLKLENVLLDHEGHIKLADYGMCKQLQWPEQKVRSFCGTPNYMAPEIIKSQPYGLSVDWWALGIILYEMLVGECPFNIIPNQMRLPYKDIVENPLHIPEYLSEGAALVLKGLLNKNPVDRLSSFSDFKSQIFFESIDWEMLEQRKVRPSYIPELDSDRDLTNFSPEFTTKPIHFKPDDHVGIDQSKFKDFEYYVSPAFMLKETTV